MTEAEADRKLAELTARRDALFSRGLTAAEDLQAYAGTMAAVFDVNISVPEFLAILERHVEKLEARYPMGN